MLRQAIRNWWSSVTGAGRKLPDADPGEVHTASAARAATALAHVQRARTLCAQGRHRDALVEIDAAARLRPDDPQILTEQADIHLTLGETADAHDCYQLALAHAPADPAALLGLARTLRAEGDLRGALERIDKAARVAPQNAAIHFEAAIVRGRCDDLKGAVDAYRRGLELEPKNAAAWTNLGLLYLSRLGDARNSQDCFERALAMSPASVEAQANLGLALEEQGRVDAALEHYEKLIAAHPLESEFRWNRGLALLASGRYARGWDDYEMRNARSRGTPPREFPFPQWDGENLPSGASLLIYGEQGLGDEIMFASCVPDVLARGIDCVLECETRLAGLFARSFPAARVHGAARDGDRRWLDDHPRIKAQCAIGSLPRLMRRDAADFPRHAGYLAADPRRVAAWRTRIKPDGRAFVIGIAWRGGTRGTRSELRSITLAELAPLFAMTNVEFVSLQRGGGHELAEFAQARGARIREAGDAPDDMEETAALCKTLDHVVTVDNSVAHLAGALGCPTSILLSHSGDWRWVRGQATSPWYPSVNLYRQAAPGAWAGAVTQLRAALATRA